MANQIIFIVGPTGSGKSEAALRLAKKLKGEIVSCDSMQSYRGMDIGTGKPSAIEQKTVRHHAINLVSSGRQFSVFQYRQVAVKAIEDILSRGKTAIVAGGSGLYFKSILDGLASHPGRDNDIRKLLEKTSGRYGAQSLYRRLQRIDPKCAERINPTDKRRIIRALEVWELSGRKMSEWEHETTPLEIAPNRRLIFGLLWDRDRLYRRVEARVDEMFRKGWVAEVRRLKSKPLSLTARMAIGYREILDYLDGKLSLEEAISETKKRTRRLVKKQMTWFRKDDRIEWLKVSGDRAGRDAADSILKRMKRLKMLRWGT